MNDYGNDPEWFTDVNGNRYQRKATASVFPKQLGEPRNRREMLADRIMDGIGTAIILAACAVGIAFCLATMGFIDIPSKSQPVNRPAVTVTDPGTCGK